VKSGWWYQPLVLIHKSNLTLRRDFLCAGLLMVLAWTTASKAQTRCGTEMHHIPAGPTEPRLRPLEFPVRRRAYQPSGALTSNTDPATFGDRYACKEKPQ
jgi:hypothetical protein